MDRGGKDSCFTIDPIEDEDPLAVSRTKSCSVQQAECCRGKELPLETRRKILFPPPSAT